MAPASDAGDRDQPSVSNGSGGFAEEYRAVRESGGEQCFERVAFPLPGEGVGNNGGDDKGAKNGGGENPAHAEESLGPHAKRYEDPENRDQNQRSEASSAAGRPFQSDLL